MEFQHEIHEETYRRVEDYLPDFFEDPVHDEDAGNFYVRYGSTVLEICVDAYGPKEASVKITSFCVQGVKMSTDLAGELLALNHELPFGSFSMLGDDIFFAHSVFGRDLDARKLLDAIAAVAYAADEYDDHLAAKYGGTTALEHIHRTGGQKRRQEDSGTESDFDSSALPS
ncbi:MAG: hypothetical protein AAF481_15730 [Acidobacteriota bacterium]